MIMMMMMMLMMKMSTLLFPINQLIVWSRKCQKIVMAVQGDIFKCLTVSDQQLNTKK